MELKIIDFDEFHKYVDSMVRLYNTTFRNKVDRTYYFWRFLENPQKELLMSIAIDKEKVVSSQSFSPMNLIYNNVVYKSALSVHQMTHPDYKGQGLNLKLTTMLIPYLVERGYKMLRGFPNQISHAPLIQRYGFHDIHEFPTLSKPVTPDDQIDPEILRDDEFQLDYNDIQRDPSKIRLDKNIIFLKWRYATCPTIKYFNFVIALNGKVKAYAVIKIFENKVNLVDYYYTIENDIQRLLARINVFASENKAEFITTWANMNSGFKIFLEKKGYQLTLPVSNFCGRILDDNTPLSYCAHDWDVVMGDDNVY